MWRAPDASWGPRRSLLLTTILRDVGDSGGALRHAVELTRYWPGVPGYERLVATLGSTER